jgi:nitrous-oxide reductase
MRLTPSWSVALFCATVFVTLACGCTQKQSSDEGSAVSLNLPGEVDRLIKDRDLKPDDVVAALATFQPSGRHDEYYMFASGGHSGQVHVVGIPSMRILRTIPVYSPDPWSGYGFGVKEPALGEYNRQEQPNRHAISWGDTHHPALSETKGEYDGEFLFINDKANGRVAVIDLRDLETKQIIANPAFNNNHGSTMVTPDTEYIVEGSQYAVPLGHKYAPIEQYQKEYRGLITFWKFDRKAGRIDPSKSFAMELPPYWQDLSDCGKKLSDGWLFVNSINTEMATGGIENGQPPFEAGVSRNDMDYMHVINWRRAEEVAKAGKTALIEGLPVIPLKTAVDEGLLYFIPEPKSPHGVDVSPSGRYIVAAGKLDPHVTIYSIDKVLAAIEKKGLQRNLWVNSVRFW